MRVEASALRRGRSDWEKNADKSQNTYEHKNSPTSNFKLDSVNIDFSLTIDMTPVLTIRPIPR